MASLEEITERLTKPGKELADWNFQLATLLDEYCTLLSERDDVNFSNAALLLQSSVEIYVRRVEKLCHDTSCLNESFAEAEAVEKDRKEAKRGARRQNFSIDFGDFEVIDSTSFNGKNNNMRHRSGSYNSAKRLTQRFPQLENISRLSLPIEVYNVLGEVVGKKCDFRLNEFLTASGMLVQQLTLADFSRVTPEESSGIVSASSPESDGGLIADLEAIRSVSAARTEIDVVGLCQDGCEDSCVVQDKETGLLDTSFASSFDSGLGSSIQCTGARPDSSLSNFLESQWEPSQSRPGSSLSTDDDAANNLPDGNSLPTEISQNEAATTIQEERSLRSTENESGETTTQLEEPSLSDRSAKAKAGSRDSSPETKAECALKRTQQAADLQAAGRSKRVKNVVIDAVKDVNPSQGEPIPSVGVPDRSSKCRAEFKLPCPISLLKFKPKPRKRTKMQRKRCLERSTSDCGPSAKKMSLYSPTRQLLFHPFKKEEFDEVPTSLEACKFEAVMDEASNLLGHRSSFRSSSRIESEETGINEFSWSERSSEELLRIAAFNYEAVTDKSMDLLGFSTSTPKSDPAIKRKPRSVNEPPRNFEPEENAENSASDSALDDFTMPDTPESSPESPRIVTPPSTPSPLSSYRTQIEESLRDIFNNDEDGERNSEMDSVATWHEFMKPKLREAERRTAFDISNYSARVFENIRATNDRRIEFKEMVRDHEPNEVARFFLASLQLANEYSVQIDTSRNVPNNFTLVLLDKDR